MTEITPSTSWVCGVPLSDSRIASCSPGSSVPIRLVAVEYRIVPSGESNVTASKLLGSTTIAWICSVSSIARSSETGPARSSGVKASVNELSAIDVACEMISSRAAFVARTLITSEPTIPSTRSPAMTPSTALAMRP